MMKKSIKMISFLLLCVLLCAVMVACSAPAAAPTSTSAQEGDTEQNGAASVEGRWEVLSVTQGDQTVTGEELVAEVGEMYYEFQSDGKFVAGAAGQEVLGTWEQTGAEVTFEVNGETQKGLIDEDTLTVEANDAISVFTRK